MGKGKGKGGGAGNLVPSEVQVMGGGTTNYLLTLSGEVTKKIFFQKSKSP